jgi:ribonuclease-3
MENENGAVLQDRMRYRYRNPKLLAEALRHSSFVNETPDEKLRDNERMEFLGDAVLNLIVGHMLMQRFPDLREGDLSRMRANLVNESQLAEMARSIDLGACIQLGKGELQTGGRNKNSILAGTYEALVASVYLDGGFEQSVDFISTHFQPLIERKPQTANQLDYKSKLQEAIQTGLGSMPAYEVVREEGPDHDKTFWVSVKVAGRDCRGSGKSKKAAEQEAARQALAWLKKKAHDGEATEGPDSL